jgi:hypothetical protein
LNDVERISRCHSVTDSVADEVSGTSIVILSVKINTLTARINSGEIKESQNEAGLKSILGRLE